ncbi:MAG: CDP-diacylglycerol--glycerol-3-phosphate 3-phosphatidyltransferase [Clostridiales bacterium]|nr:CDP-diacylglycerol--glycerol-3-phosphate 3-phosphatidyltransferase [Clostridiales bacterium]
MNTANKITLVRIVMIPLFMVAMLIELPYSRVVALIIFAIAGITDRVDGYVARKYNQVTNFGKFIDPIADKLLVTAALIILVQWGQIPSWAAVIIIAREFAVSGLRLVAVGEGVVVDAGPSGKVKTVVSIVAICFMLTDFHDAVLISGLLNVDGLAVFLMVVTTLWSGIEYFIKNRKLLNWNK